MNTHTETYTHINTHTIFYSLDLCHILIYKLETFKFYSFLFIIISPFVVDFTGTLSSFISLFLCSSHPLQPHTPVCLCPGQLHSVPGHQLPEGVDKPHEEDYPDG